MLRLAWHGHACWELQVGQRSLVVDPHDGRSIGVPPPKTRADWVVATHDHFDHTAVRSVAKDADATQAWIAPRAPLRLGPFGVETHGAYHDAEEGRVRGPVRMLVVEAGGLRIAHLGDLGHRLEAEACRRLGRPSLLMVPAGQVFTLDAEAAWATVDTIRPRVVVPMHYKTQGLALPLRDLDEFLGGRPSEQVGQRVDMEPEDVPVGPEVWVFDR